MEVSVAGLLAYEEYAVTSRNNMEIQVLHVLSESTRSRIRSITALDDASSVAI